MPQASNSFFRSEPVSVGGMPFGDGDAAIASLHGSTIAISRPPRMTNWSIAYSVASDRFCASATSSTWMSGSITCASVVTVFTWLVCRSSMVEAYG